MEENKWSNYSDSEFKIKSRRNISAFVPNDISDSGSPSSISQSYELNTDECARVNRIPTFESTINFSENKGTPIRPFKTWNDVSIQPQAYTKFKTERGVPSGKTFSRMFNL